MSDAASKSGSTTYNECNSSQTITSQTGHIQQQMDFNFSNQWTFMPNIGVGIKFKQVVLDYALSDIGDQSAAQYSHVFSVRSSIDPKY